MEIFFGENFLKIRNTCLMPLVDYGIKRSKFSHWSLKEIITNNIISLDKKTKNEIEIEIEKELFYKSLHCEIELFMNKSIIQFVDYSKSTYNSQCWSFVTLYYLSFFCTTCLLRFLRCGFIFLSKEQIDRINDHYEAVNSLVINLPPGNYFFDFKEVNANGNVVLTLKHKSDGVHKLNWIQLESILKKFLINSDLNESIIYDTFLSHFKCFSSEFPSHLRNKLNYNGESSIIDLENSLPNLDFNKLKSNFDLELKKIKITNSSCKENQIKSICLLSHYLLNLNQELYNEYLNRSKFGKDFNLERTKFLNKNGLKIN